MRIDSSYPTPIQGVSTLSPRNRARGQAGKQVNFRSDPVNKLTRRQSLRWIKKLMNVGHGDDVKYHNYKRNNEDFKVILTKTDAKLFKNNVEVPLTVPSLYSDYLATVPATDFVVNTVNDTTIIANPNKTVTMSATTDTVPVVSYINVVAALNYGETIRVKITLLNADLTTSQFNIIYVVPDLGTTEPDYDTADKARATAAVALELARQINDKADGIEYVWDPETGTYIPEVTAPLPVFASVKGSNVAVENTGTLKGITLEVTSGQGNSSVIGINSENAGIEGLPLYAKVGSVVTIKPNPTTDKGTYYLKAEAVSELTSTETLREVTWVETRKVSDAHSFTATSLPLQLVYDTATNTASISHMPLVAREVGNSESVLAPAFKNKKITAISYFQKRLVVVSENDVSMSRTDDIYNFFKKSAVQLLVTDPINIASTYTEVDYIKHVIPHNRDLMFVASNGQFKIPGDVAITPQSVSMPLTTQYKCTTNVPPVSLGNSVILPMSYGDSVGIQEYRREKNVDNDVAHQLTHHIISYMKGTITLLDSNSNLEMVVLTTSGDLNKNVIYIYEQYSEYGEHRQRAWSKWELPEDNRIVGLDFNDSKISLIVRINTSLYLKEIDLYAKVVASSTEVYLDERIQLTTTNSATSVLLPVDYTIDNNTLVVAGEGSDYPLTKVPYTASVEGSQIRLTFESIKKNGSNVSVWVGKPYTSSYRPTRPFRYTENEVAITTDKVRISHFVVNVVETAELNFKIDSPFYQTEDQRFNSRFVNGLNNLVGVQPFHTGDVRFSYAQQADQAEAEFYTDGYLNLTISGISWKGQYHESGQRM